MRKQVVAAATHSVLPVSGDLQAGVQTSPSGGLFCSSTGFWSWSHRDQITYQASTSEDSEESLSRAKLSRSVLWGESGWRTRKKRTGTAV